MRIELRPYQRGGATVHQPVVPITANEPLLGLLPFDALIDTGADFTYFPTTAKLPDQNFQAGGATGHSFTSAVLEVTLTIQHDGSSYQWQTLVHFTNHEVKPVLGYKGFLEFFSISLDTQDNNVTLKPNKNFPGRAERLWNQ